MTELAPIRREILVAAEPPLAFRVFTDQISTWWPLDDFSVHGAGSTVAFTDGVIVESAPGQPDAVWGNVTQWDPPTSLAFTWHPGAEPERASQVSVTFTAAEGQTLVRLTHSGWEIFADPEAARAEYDHGWPIVLAQLEAAFPTSDDDPVDPAETATWVALLHRPTAAASAVPDLFRDSRFGDHLAFLERMGEAGYLIAAGPLGDEPGAGMTVLRLPGADRLAEATRLATIDDESVASGFFSVTVRPWQVILHA